MQYIDFSHCKRNLNVYGGGNGSKIGIIYNNADYMLKFPQNIKDNKRAIKGEYSNNCINEYISCHIFQALGFEVQETILGTYNDKIVVACKDFREQGYEFSDFASLKNSVIDINSNGYETELDDILQTFEKQKQFPQISSSALKTHFWQMFVVDCFLGNFDRHNGNWGFLVNKNLADVKIAPIFDCASCLFPQANNDKTFELGLKDSETIVNRLYLYPNSAIKQNGIKLNVYNFLTQTDNADYLNALKEIASRIDIKAIDSIINQTPYISDLNKVFLSTMLRDRQEKILQKALSVNKHLDCSIKAFKPKQNDLEL